MMALVTSSVLIASLGASGLADDLAFPGLQNHGSQFTRLNPIEMAPSKPVIGLDGSLVQLERFRDQVVILNFWATWCAACRYELPALDRLSRDFREQDLAVVAVSIDQDGFTSVPSFLRQHKIADLDVYLDPEQSLGSQFLRSEASGALPLFGLPVTYFIDRSGNVLGYISGAVEWDSREARDFLDYLLSAEQKIDFH